MNQDYKDLLSAFHAHGVKYLIVGGYAVIFHAQPRATKDIDLFISPRNLLQKTRDLADVEDIRAASESVEPASPRKKPPEPAPGGGPGQ